MVQSPQDRETEYREKKQEEEENKKRAEGEAKDKARKSEEKIKDIKDKMRDRKVEPEHPQEMGPEGAPQGAKGAPEAGAPEGGGIPEAGTEGLGEAAPEAAEAAPEAAELGAGATEAAEVGEAAIGAGETAAGAGEAAVGAAGGTAAGAAGGTATGVGGGAAAGAAGGPAAPVTVPVGAALGGAAAAGGAAAGGAAAAKKGADKAKGKGKGKGGGGKLCCLPIAAGGICVSFPTIIIGALFILFIAIMTVIFGGGNQGLKAKPCTITSCNLHYPSDCEVSESQMAENINKYIASKVPSSPLKGRGNKFVEAGKKYDVNPGLVVGIAEVESTLGTAIPCPSQNSCNAWGRTATSIQPHCVVKGRKWIIYGDWDTAIDQQTYYMKQRYLDQGLDTLETMMPVYCEGDVSGYIATLKKIIPESTGCPCETTSCSDEDGSTEGGEVGQRVVAVAQKELKTMPCPCESGSAETNCPEKYGCGSNAWCSCLVSWCYKEAKAPIGHSTSNWCWPYSKDAADNLDIHDNDPQPGDAWVKYVAGDDPPCKHIGIIEKVEGDTVYTLEGNSGDCIKERTYGMSEFLSSRANYIVGGGRFHSWKQK